MTTTKKKPGPKHIEFDYDAVAFFCRSQISDAGLARKLHVSPQLLAYHLNKDPKLREAREGGSWDGKNIISDAMFKKMMDRYMTVCNDCEKIRFSFDKFYDKCPYCDASRPVDPVTGKDEFGNDHTNVTHKFIPGDTSIMIHWSKKHLDMNDRIIHEGNGEKPLVFSTLAEFAMHQAKKQDGKASKVLSPDKSI